MNNKNCRVNRTNGSVPPLKLEALPGKDNPLGGGILVPLKIEM